MDKKESRILLGRIDNEAKEWVDSRDHEALTELGLSVLNSDNIIGSPDEFHNFAVNFAKTDDKIMACEILKRGLSKYPRSVDLLADFLQYGMDCGEEALCLKYYEELQKIPKELWTWRGFDFALDYLQAKIDTIAEAGKYEETKREMIELVTEFRQYMPYEERSYLAESRLYKNSNKELKILEEAMSQLKSCPKCALRYADLQCEMGEYVKALNGIKQCLSSLKTQSGINEGYAYFLSGLCQTGILHTTGDYSNSESVRAIYQDFQVAEMESLGLQATYRKTIKRQTSILAIKSGIFYSGEYDE